MKTHRVCTCILSLTVVATMTAGAEQLPPARIFELASPSIVVVSALGHSGTQTGQGSGVVVGERDVVTNCHVLRGSASINVKLDGQALPADLVDRDDDKDLCLLQVEGLTAVPAQLGSTADLRVGDAVYAIGSPHGYELSMSSGIVSQLRDLRMGAPVIQTTAPISIGSSGGGLFDEQGNLVGITSFYLKGAQSLNFALPVEWVLELSATEHELPLAPASSATPAARAGDHAPVRRIACCTVRFERPE